MAGHRVSSRRLLLPIAVAAACTIPFGHASSQGARSNVDESADEAAIDEIVVTGSRIKRRDFVTPSPLATLDQGDILISQIREPHGVRASSKMRILVTIAPPI